MLSLLLVGWLLYGQSAAADVNGVDPGAIDREPPPAAGFGAADVRLDVDAGGARQRAGGAPDVAPAAEVMDQGSAGPPVTYAPLEGQVVDVDGIPVAGAEVRVWSGRRVTGEPRVTVAASGTGHFSATGFGPDFIAAAFYPEMVGQQGLRGTMAEETQCVGLQLVLAPAYEFHGTVVHEDGSPIEGAVMELGSALNSSGSDDVTETPGVTTFGSIAGAIAERQVTGADGRFRFPGVGGGRVSVRVEAPGLVGEWVSHSPKDGEARITLERGRTMSGLVLDSEGAPVAGAKVRFGPHSSNLGVNRSTTETDGDGRFEVSGLDREGDEWDKPPFVAALCEGHTVALVQPAALDGDGESNVLRLEPAAPLAGRVLQGDGTPAAGIRLRLETERLYERSYIAIGRPPTWESLFSEFQPKTGDDGSFAFAHRVDGPCTLRVFAPGLASGQALAVPVARGQATVEVVLDAKTLLGVVLRGRVVDADGGGPIPKFEIRPWQNSEDGSGAVTRTESVEENPVAPGTFELRGLEELAYGLEFDAEGYAPTRLPPKVYGLGENELGDIELTRSTTLRVEVVDGAGAPWRGGTLCVEDVGGEPRMLRIGPMTTTHASLNGKVLVLEDLPRRPLTVVVETAVGNRKELSVDPRAYEGSTLTITVERPKMGSLMVLLLERSALGADADAFVADLRTAAEAEDMEWFQANGQRFLAAMPKRALDVRLSRDGSALGRGSIEWVEATGQYNVKTSYGSTSEQASGVPTPDLQWGELSQGTVELTVSSGGDTLTTLTLEVLPTGDVDRPIPTFVLL